MQIDMVQFKKELKEVLSKHNAVLFVDNMFSSQLLSFKVQDCNDQEEILVRGTYYLQERDL